MQTKDYKKFIVADIPGLIAGAHEGAGMGDKFLRHIERTKIICHLIDISFTGHKSDPIADFKAINSELKLFNPALATKSQIIIATKMDNASRSKLDKLIDFCKKNSYKYFIISALKKEGLEPLISYLSEQLG